MKRHGASCVGLAGLVLSAALSACAGTAAARGTATVPAGVTSTTADPWAVPPVLDVAYLQRVMDRLDQSLGDALREMVRAKSVDPKVQQILRAIYAEPELSRTLRDLEVSRPGDVTRYRAVPGDPVTKITLVLSATSACAFYQADRTLGPALQQPPPDQNTHGFLAVRRMTASPGTSPVNPTHWWLVLDALSPSGQTPKDPCS